MVGREPTTQGESGYLSDFWLYDARITFDFTAEAFAEALNVNTALQKIDLLSNNISYEGTEP